MPSGLTVESLMSGHQQADEKQDNEGVTLPHISFLASAGHISITLGDLHFEAQVCIVHTAPGAKWLTDGRAVENGGLSLESHGPAGKTTGGGKVVEPGVVRLGEKEAGVIELGQSSQLPHRRQVLANSQHPDANKQKKKKKDGKGIGETILWPWDGCQIGYRAWWSLIPCTQSCTGVTVFTTSPPISVRLHLQLT